MANVDLSAWRKGEESAAEYIARRLECTAQGTMIDLEALRLMLAERPPMTAEPDAAARGTGGAILYRAAEEYWQEARGWSQSSHRQAAMRSFMAGARWQMACAAAAAPATAGSPGDSSPGVPTVPPEYAAWVESVRAHARLQQQVDVQTPPDVYRGYLDAYDDEKDAYRALRAAALRVEP